MSNLAIKVQKSIKTLQLASPGTGLFGDSGSVVAFSGGKDSLVIKTLADMAGIPYTARYSATGVDPGQLITYIRKYHSDVMFRKPKKSMRQLIVENMIPPLRQMRYCCRVLKETDRSEVVVTGIRKAESANRNKRRDIEACYRTGNYIVNPIIEWSDNDVWDFIKAEGLPYCELYDNPEIKRIGCVLCPNAGKKGMQREAEMWPGITYGYRLACREAYKRIIECGKTVTWKSGDDMYEWWLSGANGVKRIAQSLQLELSDDIYNFDN